MGLFGAGEHFKKYIPQEKFGRWFTWVVNGVITIARKGLSSLFNSLAFKLGYHTKTDASMVAERLIAYFSFLSGIGLQYAFSTFTPSTGMPHYPDDSYGNGTFMSFKWYYDAAYQLTIQLITDMAVDLVMNFIQPITRAHKLITILLNTNQHTINMSFYPPEWELHSQLASTTRTMLNISLVAGFYPFVTLLGAVYFYASFRIEKRNLLTYFRTPPHYSYQILEHTLSEFSISSLLFTLFNAVSQASFLFTEPEVREAHPFIIINPILLTATFFGILLFTIISYCVNKRQTSLTNANKKKNEEDLEKGNHSSQQSSKPVKPEIDVDDDYDDNEGDETYPVVEDIDLRDETNGEEYATWAPYLTSFVDMHPLYSYALVQSLLNNSPSTSSVVSSSSKSASTPLYSSS